MHKINGMSYGIACSQIRNPDILLFLTVLAKQPGKVAVIVNINVSPLYSQNCNAISMMGQVFNLHIEAMTFKQSVHIWNPEFFLKS